MRRGIRFPQWWMLLVAILSILSGQGSLVGTERIAKRHRQTINDLMGTDFGQSTSDSTFRLLLAKNVAPGFENPAAGLDGGLAKRGRGAGDLGLRWQNAAGLDRPNRFWRSALWPPADYVYIAQVSLYSQKLGVAIAQTNDATDASGEIQALRQLLEAVELECVLVQTDARMRTTLFPIPRPAQRRLTDRR